MGLRAVLLSIGTIMFAAMVVIGSKIALFIGGALMIAAILRDRMLDRRTARDRIRAARGRYPDADRVGRRYYTF